MITDARVLQQEFIPREVRHRDSEVNYLSSILKAVTNGNSTEPTLLYGPSGVGKTCIAQYIVEELRGNVVDLNTQYVNCWEDYTRFKTLYQLLDGIGEAYDIHRQSTPRDLLLDRLRKLTLPALSDVEAGLDSYIQTKERAEELEEKIERTDELIDEIVYDLYGVTDEEIEIIEEARVS